MLFTEGFIYFLALVLSLILLFVCVYPCCSLFVSGGFKSVLHNIPHICYYNTKNCWNESVPQYHLGG